MSNSELVPMLVLVTHLFYCLFRVVDLSPSGAEGKWGKLNFLPPLQSNDLGLQLGPWKVNRGFLGLKQVPSRMSARSLSFQILQNEHESPTHPPAAGRAKPAAE
jgi:hypothetical protein